MTLTVTYIHSMLSALLPHLEVAFAGVPFFDPMLDVDKDPEGDEFYITLEAPRPSGGERSYQVILGSGGVEVRASYETAEEGRKTHHREWKQDLDQSSVVREVCADAVTYFMRDYAP